jgi:hypothetical protein
MQQCQKLSLKKEHDLLWREQRIYVPDVDNLRADLLFWFHDVPWMGHLGINRTLQMIST